MVIQKYYNYPLSYIKNIGKATTRLEKFCFKTIPLLIVKASANGRNHIKIKKKTLDKFLPLTHIESVNLIKYHIKCKNTGTYDMSHDNKNTCIILKWDKENNNV